MPYHTTKTTYVNHKQYEVNGSNTIRNSVSTPNWRFLLLLVGALCMGHRHGILLIGWSQGQSLSVFTTRSHVATCTTRYRHTHDMISSINTWFDLRITCITWILKDVDIVLLYRYVYTSVFEDISVYCQSKTNDYWRSSVAAGRRSVTAVRDEIFLQSHDRVPDHL